MAEAAAKSEVFAILDLLPEYLSPRNPRTNFLAPIDLLSASQSSKKFYKGLNNSINTLLQLS